MRSFSTIPFVAKRLLSCWLLAVALASGSSIRSQDRVSEAELKAAFLYNFTKFVEWPEEGTREKDAPFLIGVFGDEELIATFRRALTGKKAHGHPILVKKLTDNREALPCQILFFRDRESKRLTQLDELLRGRPIMTVGETEEFLELGGMFNLVFEDKQLRFQVNTSASESAKLSIDSKLLRLAKRIRKGVGK